MKKILIVALLAGAVLADCTLKQRAYSTGYDSGKEQSNADGYEANYMVNSACNTGNDIFTAKTGKPGGKAFNSACKLGGGDGLHGRKPDGALYSKKCSYM